MQALIDAIMNPVNLFFTILLGLVVLYWLMVILGALAVDSLDLDVDTDVDFDVDADVDIDADLDIDADADMDADIGHAGPGAHGLGHSILVFFNLGQVPLLVLLSVFILTMWFTGIATHPILGDWSMFAQVAMVIPYAIGAMMVTKIITQPLAVFFKRVKEQERAEQNTQILGRRCRVVSGVVDLAHGQVEIETDGAPVKLNARTKPEHTNLKKGDEAVLIAHNRDKGFYLVREF